MRQWEPRGYPDLASSSVSGRLFNNFLKLAPFRKVLLPAGSLGILNRIDIVIIKVLALDNDKTSLILLPHRLKVLSRLRPQLSQHFVSSHANQEGPCLSALPVRQFSSVVPSYAKLKSATQENFHSNTALLDTNRIASKAVAEVKVAVAQPGVTGEAGGQFFDKCNVRDVYVSSVVREKDFITLSLLNQSQSTQLVGENDNIGCFQQIESAHPDAFEALFSSNCF
jgi:hypothetical protein